MKIRGTSIKTRIFLVLVLLPFISLTIVGLIAVMQNSASLIEHGESSLKLLINEKTDHYEHIFMQIKQDATATASYAEMIYQLPELHNIYDQRVLLPWTGEGYGDEGLEQQLADEILRLKHIPLFLKALVDNNHFYTLGYIGSESGITTFHDDGLVDIIMELEGFDPRERPWYIAAKEERGTILTDLYVDAHTKELTVTAAAPIYKHHGALAGVAGLDVLLETLQHDIIDIDLGYENEPFMINDRGQVIVSRDVEDHDIPWYQDYFSDSLLETPNAEFNAIIERMVAGEAGIAQFTSEEDVLNYLVFSPITTVRSSLGIIIPHSEIVMPVQESGRFIIIVLAITMVLAIAIGLFLGRQITEPIEELTVMVDKASKGLLEVDEIPIRRMDEVGILAASFNRMINNLSTVMKELEKKESINNGF